MKAWDLCGMGLGVRRWSAFASVRVTFPTSRQILDRIMSGNAGSCKIMYRKVALLAVFGSVIESMVKRGEFVPGFQAEMCRCV